MLDEGLDQFVITEHHITKPCFIPQCVMMVGVLGNVIV